MKERKPPRPTCTDHCTGCGRHFHGLAAFDRHRVDGHCTDPVGLLMRSKGGDERPSLQQWTPDGYCDKERGCWEEGKRVRYVHPVTIWQVATTEEQRLALAELNAIHR